MVKILSSVILYLTSLSGFAAANGLICVPEQSTGFVLNGDKWKKTSFNVEDVHHLIVKPTIEQKKKIRNIGIEPTEWVVNLYGSDILFLPCARNNKFYFCDGFTIDINNNSFIHSSIDGFLIMECPKGDKGCKDASLTIGRCSSF